jgi:hypothetical protein
MMYDLGRPIFNNAPQWPKFPSTSMAVQLLTATESANIGEAWTRAVAWDEGEMA